MNPGPDISLLIAERSQAVAAIADRGGAKGTTVPPESPAISDRGYRKSIGLPAMVLLILIGGPPAIAENMVPNPGFEDIEGDQPINWNAPQAKGFECKVSTDDRHGGKAALRIALNHEAAKVFWDWSGWPQLLAKCLSH